MDVLPLMPTFSLSPTSFIDGSSPMDMQSQPPLTPDPDFFDFRFNTNVGDYSPLTPFDYSKQFYLDEASQIISYLEASAAAEQQQQQPHQQQAQAQQQQSWLQSPPSSPPLDLETMQMRRMHMMHEIQLKNNELRSKRHRSQTSPMGSVHDSGDDACLAVASQSRHVCKHPRCHKSFQRYEHLKRHMKSSHSLGGENRYTCEFCGKSQFNRRDNLNYHRKLHARDNGKGSRVVFIPEAVPILEKEEQMRRKKSL